MAFQLEIGQYYRTHSAIHQLDARVKICSMILFMVGFFLISTPLQLLFGIVIALSTLALSHIPPRHILHSLKPILLLLAFISAFNLFVVQTGSELFHLAFIRITLHGIWSAIIYATRFACAISLGSLLLLTTTPTELSDAFDSLLSPLAKIGLPAHEIAMVFSLMMRFIPLLADEMSSLLDAQTLRGVRFDEGSLPKRLKALMPLIVALFAGGIRHAQGLARALDARCYESGELRSHYHVHKIAFADIATLLLGAIFIAAMLGMAQIA